ncbi:YvgZ [Streptomyces azureus]|uniref:YvgZ n=2 Tax=Streptomyces azureus TaxID=146537 RepID=A0A0K8PLM3_STRAJ|nr:YvgZ [Streptomyces azureus]
MVEEETYCIDVLTQVAATNAALQPCALALLDERLNCCVTEAIVEGGEQARTKVNEASKTIARLVRA